MLQPVHEGICAGCDLVHRRIRHDEFAVADTAVYMHDGVAGHATQPSLSFWSIDLIFDRLIKPAVEEYSVVRAAGTPLPRLSADYVLHVFNGFAIERVVKRGEVMGGTFPLLIDIPMTFAAFFRFHEERRGDKAAVSGIGA